MIRIVLPLLAWVVVCCLPATGQPLLGIANSNYAGVNGLHLNPSNIADARHGFYLNLAVANLNFSNNYLSLQNKRQVADLFAGNELDFNPPPPNGKAKFMDAGGGLHLPSLVLRLSHRHSIALTGRFRTAVQLTRTSEELAQLLIFGPEGNSVPSTALADQQLNLDLNGFGELGFSYARVVKDAGSHFFKAGFTLKKLYGAYAGALRLRTGNYTLQQDNEDHLLVMNDVSIRGGTALEQLENDLPDDWKAWRRSGKGWGADLGFTYEYRPDYARYQYRKKGEQRSYNINKYKYRVGVSLTDLGGIRYEDPRSVQAYTIDRPQIAFHTSQFEAAVDDDLHPWVDSTIALQPGEASHALRTGLPTAFNLSFDYHATGKIYLNLQWIQNVRNAQTLGLRQPSLLAVTPRLEMRVLEIAFPLVIYHQYQPFAAGFSLRAGPLLIGSDNLLGLLGVTKIYGMSAYAGLAFTLGGARYPKAMRAGRRKKSESVPKS